MSENQNEQPPESAAPQGTEPVQPQTKEKRKKRQPIPKTAKVDDFYGSLPENKYLYVPTRDLWPESTITKILGPDKPEWLSVNRPLHQRTWCPGLPFIIADRVASQNAGLDQTGATTFNAYLPPTPISRSRGDPAMAGPWRDHGRKIFGDDFDHIEMWLAHRVQKPHVKINHALVIGSPKQGIGKDLFLSPIKRAVGPWNWRDISARQAFESAIRGYNG